MSKAAANPEEIRRFAHELKRFNDDMEQNAKSIKQRFGKLGETWQDQEYLHFSETFKNLMKELSRFHAESIEVVPMLMRKAERLDDYLKQR